MSLGLGHKKIDLKSVVLTIVGWLCASTILDKYKNFFFAYIKLVGHRFCSKFEKLSPLRMHIYLSSINVWVRIICMSM